ncbi:Long chain acyl-CoA synthetase 5, partial [Glycine soja]
MNSNMYMISFGIVEIIFSQISSFDQLWWLSIVAVVMSFTYSTIRLGLGIGKVIENRGVGGSLTRITVGTVTQTEKVWRTMQALGDIAFAHSYSLILGEPCKLLGVKCGIYGANSAEWIMSMQACNAHGLYCVPLYDTLGAGAIVFIICHSEVSIAFAEEKKIPEDVKLLIDDVGELKPTIFCVVPRVLDRVYSGLTQKISSGGFLKKTLSNFAYSYKLNNMKKGIRHGEASPLLDKIVFDKVKQGLGGRVRLILSRVAPLSTHVEGYLQWRAGSSQGLGNYELGKASWSWSWKDRWIVALPTFNYVCSKLSLRSKHLPTVEDD